MGGFVSGWICLLTPNVLVQAASGNDEVMAAGPIVIGLGFALEWLHTSRMRYALLAGIGIGLGFGTKLHWAFYVVFLGTAAVFLAVVVFRRPEYRLQLSRRAPAVLAAALVATPLAGAFLVSNYISTKHFTATEFNNLVLNTPFRLSLAREKILTSTGEMLLSPIPDLLPPSNSAERQATYSDFNKFFMKCCFTSLVETTKRSPEGYKFLGPADQLAFQPAETTVWLGFLPHFLILVGLVQVFTRRLPFACITLMLAFWFWHFTYTMQTRYIWWACTYYAFPAVVSTAALGLVWDFARSSRGAASRLLVAGFAVVIGTHMLLAGNLLVFGGLRNLQFVWGPAVAAPHPVDKPVATALESARKVYIPGSHWEILYWNFMRFNPGARYTTGPAFRAPSADTLMLLPISPVSSIATGPRETLTSGTFPARLPGGSAPALTYVGQADSDNIFAQGDGIETRYPDRARYALLRVEWRQDTATGTLLSAQGVDCCTGLGSSDGVTVRYVFQSSTTGENIGSDWLVVGQLIGGLSPASKGRYDTLVIEARDIKRSDSTVRTLYPLDQNPYQVGKNETSYTGTSPNLFPVTIALRPEPYQLNGKQYTVSWLGKDTQFTVLNSGAPMPVTIEFRLAVGTKPHTALLASTGGQPNRGVIVRPKFWESGAQTVRFEANLATGSNRFVLSSKEPAELLPDGRPACFLLVGDLVVTSGTGNPHRERALNR
jgi:hypothetical protein